MYVKDTMVTEAECFCATVSQPVMSQLIEKKKKKRECRPLLNSASVCRASEIELTIVNTCYLYSEIQTKKPLVKE